MSEDDVCARLREIPIGTKNPDIGTPPTEEEWAAYGRVEQILGTPLYKVVGDYEDWSCYLCGWKGSIHRDTLGPAGGKCCPQCIRTEGLRLAVDPTPLRSTDDFRAHPKLDTQSPYLSMPSHPMMNLPIYRPSLEHPHPKPDTKTLKRLPIAYSDSTIVPLPTAISNPPTYKPSVERPHAKPFRGLANLQGVGLMPVESTPDVFLAHDESNTPTGDTYYYVGVYDGVAYYNHVEKVEVFWRVNGGHAIKT